MPVIFNETFDSFEGLGFSTAPTSGQLSSSFWSLSGLSQGDLAFGAEGLSGDYARGVTDGGAFSGGVYALNNVDLTGDAGDSWLYVQPTGSDMTPGAVTLRITNTTGEILENIALSHDVLAYNRGDRSVSVTLSVSLDGESFTEATSFLTDEALDNLVTQHDIDLSLDVLLGDTQLSTGESVYFRWAIDDAAGSGSRDAIALNDVVVTADSAGVAAGTLDLLAEAEGLTSFAGQDAGTGVLGLDGADLTGNAWKTIATDITVTELSQLTIGYTGTTEAEIVGIAFVRDGQIDPAHVIQLAGSQTFGVQTFNLGSVAALSAAGVLSLDIGSVFTGTFDEVVLIQDQDAGSTEFTGTFDTVALSDRLDTEYNLLDVSGQSFEVTPYAKENQGASIVLDGDTLLQAANGWHGIDLSGVTLTRDSVLRFDFGADAIAEMQGIAFVNNDRIDAATTFQLAGTQIFGQQMFHTYEAGDGVVSYELAIGELLHGQSFEKLVFVNDNDASAEGNVGWRNISLGTADSTSLSLAIGGDMAEVTLVEGQSTGGLTLSEDGRVLELAADTWAKIDLSSMTLTEETVLRFTVEASGAREILGLGLGDANGVAAGNVLQLAGDQDHGARYFEQYENSDGSVTYEIAIGTLLTPTQDTLYLINDDDRGTGGAVSFADLELVSQSAEMVIDGAQFMTGDFDGQNGGGYELHDGGETLVQTTNAWTEIDITGQVFDADTVLSFVFDGLAEGEIAGIALVNGDTLDPATVFQIGGTQTFGDQTYRGYSYGSGPTQFNIDLSALAGQSFDKLVLINDSDAGTGGAAMWTDLSFGAEETPSGAAVILAESFETDGNGTRYVTSTTEFSDGGGDFFGRTDGSNIGSYYQVDGQEGDFFFGAMDIDGEGASAQQSLTFEGLDIAGMDDLVLAFSLAEDDDGTNQDWDASDYFTASYSVDGGAWVKVFEVRSSTGGTNGEPSVDTDFDGVGDGAALTDAFQEFQTALTGVTGSTIDIRFDYSLNSGDEDIALDRITLTNGAPTGTEFDAEPTPVTINEFRVSSPGASDDTSNFVELHGQAGASSDGLTLLAISGEYEPGSVDFAISLDGGMFDDNGILLIAEETHAALNGNDVGVAGLDFFGSPQTFLVVEGYTGAQGDDLDATNDGVLDGFVEGETYSWGTVVTGLSLVDGDATADMNYAADVLPASGSFTQSGAARAVDGDTTSDWEFYAFDDLTTDTPGALNAGDSGTGTGETPDEVTLISSVQGSGNLGSMAGQTVTVQAVVTYVVSNGFFLQEEDADADGDASTSEGLFVYYSGTLPSLGDRVSVSGEIVEYYDLTEMTNVSTMNVLDSNVDMPTPVTIEVGPEGFDYESAEGMLVEVVSGTSDALTVTENFNLDRYGQFTVSAGTKLQPTQVFDAQTQADEVAALAQENINNGLLIDDGSSTQNPTEYTNVANTSVGDNGNGYLDASDSFAADGPTVRLGAEVSGTPTGVLTYAFGEWVVNANAPVAFDAATNEGARPTEAPDVGGDIQVAGFNVLNFFTTLNERGATTSSDLDRQTVKIVEAMLGTGAEVFAIQEIENNGFGEGSAIDTLVDALNAADGSARFAYVDPTLDGGMIGTDQITTGLIYDTTALDLITSDSIVFAEASNAETSELADITAYQRNRPTIAATFADADSGTEFTLASVHFKSKGDSGLADAAAAAQAAVDAGTATQDQIDLLADGNVDSGNGQGYWNQVRADAAAELLNWLETGYDGTGVTNYLVMGDLNAYSQEDPVQAFTQSGEITDLIDQFIGLDSAYSYVYDGQQGALDQALASNELAGLVTGTAEWHINADEPDLLSYNSAYSDAGFYNEDVFASSDHDPVIVGIAFDTPLV